MYTIRLAMEPTPGSNLYGAIAEAKDLSKKNGQEVLLVFNGCVLHVAHTSDYEEITREYDTIQISYKEWATQPLSHGKI